ncbi:pseudouridylate synthase 1 homolog [Discoglossus pictus]
MRRVTKFVQCTWSRQMSSLNPLGKKYEIPHQSATKIDKEMSPELNAHGENTNHFNDVSENNVNSSLFPRRKFALLLAYCGHGYYGMQINPGRPDLPTIEATLISALIKAQCLPETCTRDMKHLQFQRCARTDKGVSALGQLVSVRLLTSCTNPVEQINSFLPPEIRLIDMKRVTKRFNSKNLCDGRTYSYMVPTFALSKCASSIPDPSFRLPREDFHKVNTLLSFYKGTHNFHNFTSRKSGEDPSAWRHMLDVSCSEPFVHHGIEFVSILITGQSFMLYQIRKMVGLIIAVAQGIVPSDFLPQCVRVDKVNIPPAPGLGLVLERVYFDNYNKRYGGDGFHQALTWEDNIPLVAAFWEEKIMPIIIHGELEELSMCYWLDTLRRHIFGGFKNRDF